jgi:hypothetical protein
MGSRDYCSIYTTIIKDQTIFFDSTIQTHQFDILPIPDEEQPHLLLQFILGLGVPGPNGQIGILPAGALKIPIGREMAIAKAKQLLEAAESLPEPKPESDLIVTDDMNQAAEMAKVQQAIHDGAAK